MLCVFYHNKKKSRGFPWWLSGKSIHWVNETLVGSLIHKDPT